MILHHYKKIDRDSNHYVVAFPRPDPKLTKEIRTWCYQSYGEPDYRYLTDEIRWLDYIRCGEICFTRESDLSFFMLRWS